MDLRILKDLAREIAELRILKDLGKSTVDGSQSRIGKEPELQAILLLEHRGEHTHPRQFVSLSKERSCKMGSLELHENKEDSEGQKGQNRKRKAAMKKQKAEGAENMLHRETWRGPWRLKVRWSREFTTHAIVYFLFCQVLLWY